MRFNVDMLVEVDLDEGSKPLTSSQDLGDAIAAAVDQHVTQLGGGARGSVNVLEIGAEAIEGEDEEDELFDPDDFDWGESED